MPVEWGWRIPSRITDPRLRKTFQSLERYLIQTDNPDPDPLPPDPDPPPDDPDPPPVDPPPVDPPPPPPPGDSSLTGSYGSLACTAGTNVTFPAAPTTLGSRGGLPLFSWNAGSRECTYLGPGLGSIGAPAVNLRVTMTTHWYTPQVEADAAREFRNRVAVNGAWLNIGAVTIPRFGVGGPTVTATFVMGPISVGDRILFAVSQGVSAGGSGGGVSGGIRYTLDTAYSLAWESDV